MNEALQTILDALDLGVLLIDERGCVSLVNETMASLLARPPTEFVGRSSIDLAHHLRELASGGPPVVAEARLFSGESKVVCEEFELKHPQHSVVRWVTRRISVPGVALLATALDITTEVDLAVTNERHALTDRLTGLTNRRGMEGVLRTELARSRRSGKSFSVVLCDIDHFKRVNDVHGHNTGDIVLSRVGAALAKTVRSSDTAARWGGEEFLIFLPETDLAGGRTVAERLRESIEQLELSCGRVTLSSGVAHLNEREEINDLIARADARLYQAKSSGRNRVCA